MATIFEAKLRHFENRLLALVADAAREGVVLEIRLEPTQPLRMGGYAMKPMRARYFRDKQREIDEKYGSNQPTARGT